MEYIIYTDGSFRDGYDNKAHGGIVFAKNEIEFARRIHVFTSIPQFVCMWSAGGEVLAAWSAIFTVINTIKREDPEKKDKHKLTLIYDNQGVGEWLSGGFKRNTIVTKWYHDSVMRMLTEFPNFQLDVNWVKGHSSTELNNEADRVARYTMEYCKAYNIPICDMDEVLKDELNYGN